MHQNRASRFASDFYRRRAYRRELRSEDHFYPFSSQKNSRFASDFFSQRKSPFFWGPKKSRDSLPERSKSLPQPQRIARFWCTQFRTHRIPKGPKIEKHSQDRPQGLKISSQIEDFKRAAHQTPIFCGECKVKIEIFKRD